MKCCGKPSKECLVKRLGWTSMSRSVVDSSYSVRLSLLYCFRTFVFLFCVFISVSHYVSEEYLDVAGGLGWFNFLTHWNIINCCVYFGLSSVLALSAMKDPTRSLVPLSSSKFGCFVHFMFELSFVTAWFVSLLYWIALYPNTKHPPEGYFAFLNVAMHGLPALWVMAELFLGAQLFVHFHLTMMYFYFLVYLAVNAAITIITNDAIYSILTYENATTAIWVGVSLVLVALIWLGGYLCVRLRSRCCSRHRARSVVVFSKDSKPAPVPIV